MNTALIDENKAKLAKKLIVVLSIVIPLVVAALFGIKVEGVDFSFLPPIYAGINALTALTLIGALLAIKFKKQNVHRALIRFALALSLVFLVCYVAYHMTSDPTTYVGSIKWPYYALLISHILLSVVVVPMVLFTYLFAWQGDYEKHKRWTRITWPLWFYVALSGVVVYLMISPYY